MLEFNINPTLFNIGPFEIRYYGLIYVLGFLLVYWILLRKKEELGLDAEKVESFLVYLMVGVIIGSRLGEVLLWNPAYYLSSPLEILKIWKGGMAFHGGLIGAVIAGWIYSRKYKINFAKLADIVSLPAVFMLAIGRIGNFINGEIYGTVTNVSWCVKFPDAEGCRHPYQIYAFLKRMAVFFILLWISRCRKFKEGFIFWGMMTLLGIGRVFLDILREDAVYFGLKSGQWFSLAMFIIGIYVLARYYQKDLKGLFRPEAK